MNPIDRILSVISPYACVRCGQEGAALCVECSEYINDLPSVCYACGKAAKNFRPCPGCIKAASPQHVWIASEYSGVAKDVLHAYKFDYQRGAAAIIAGIVDAALPYFATPPLVTFVPTATSHRRQRGFDHAELLARELARQRGWNYMRLLYRKNQVRQLGADRKTRKEQLKEAFVVSGAQAVAGKHILLIDDVLTTGATVEACTKLLKAAGASEVDAVVFARTPNKQ